MPESRCSGKGHAFYRLRKEHFLKAGFHTQRLSALNMLLPLCWFPRLWATQTIHDVAWPLSPPFFFLVFCVRETGGHGLIFLLERSFLFASRKKTLYLSFLAGSSLSFIKWIVSNLHRHSSHTWPSKHRIWRGAL